MNADHSPRSEAKRNPSPRPFVPSSLHLFAHLSISPFALALAAFLLYLRTLAPGLLDGDSGEFQIAAPLLGVVHSTGYPLYLLLGKLFTLLPFGDLAWRVNLLSAVCAAAAVGVTCLLAHRLAVRVSANVPSWVPHTAAVFAACAFALSPTFWSQAVIAEVYGLNALLVALTLYFIVRWADLGFGIWDLGFAALCFGLGLAHHRTIVLLLPALVVYALMARPSGVKALAGSRLKALLQHVSIRSWLLALPLALAPLLLYAYIPLRAPHTPYLRVELAPGTFSWLYQNDVPGFLALVTGSTFGGSLGLGPDWLDRLRLALDWLAAQFPYFGMLAGLCGAAWQVYRRRADFALLGLTFLATAGFCLVYRIGDVYVLYVPAYLCFAGWLATGAAWLLGWLATSERRTWRRTGLLAAGLVFVSVPAFSLAGNFAAMDRSGDTSARARGETILAQPLPSGAVLVTNDRNEAVPLLYLQHVEGRRPDLTILFPSMFPGPAWADVGGVTGQALATGRPVYLIKPMPGLEIAYALRPAGPIVQVAGPARTDLAHPLDLPVGDALHLTGYEASPARLGQTMTVTLAWRVVKPLPDRLGLTMRLADTTGDIVAAWDGQPGGEFYPSAHWQPGQRLRAVGSFALPANLPPGDYTLRAGFYTLPALDPLPTPAGDIPILGMVIVSPP